ncbi:LysR family transcriptional regulator [Gulosibacter molinativorax]|uniref:LysR family transcriptional regulator n=1 Tax=Gulosibacter molinativorax TaxID=256821 RepID=A0ABT7C8U6_9MICO|nr:LysR family transcriptional regulator [Gulosibacter molinativorax]MDJ1371633.1 LysR family transcriptional regulator [Gulosibacter molinativorax]QUY61023.1 LysR family transcriptional regulator YnfL [Gulosibacter molinativorax]
MEIRHIRAFVALAQELHFGRAAERLHLAQPYLSRQISQLERSLDATLFDRSTRTVTLSSVGEAFLPAAKQALNSFDAAKAIVAQARDGEIGLVHIGIGGIAMQSLLPIAASSLRERKPGITLSITSGVFSRDGLHRVLDGDLDIAFVRGPDQIEGVSSRVVENERLVLAVPPNHQLASSEGVPLTELANEEFVGYPQNESSTTLRDFVNYACMDNGFTPKYVQFGSETSAILSMVAAGLGVALTVSSVVGHVAHNVKFVPLAGKQYVSPSTIAWNPQRLTPATKAVLEVLNEVMPTPDEDL